MTAEELGRELVARLAAGEGEPRGEESTAGSAATMESAYGDTTVDVDPAHWVTALRIARDDLGCTFFDWLTAVDDLDAGFRVVACVWRLAVGAAVPLLVRTRVPRANPHLDSLTGVFPGANWPERETYEMFDIRFDGHPHLVPLLLPDGFEGHPLRKEFVLAARVARPWPGAKEPGESDAGAPTRRRMQPPGVPEPGSWGPAS
jgi:NADH-quinone oxidoreductase subunit C